uniref:Uncharacterized protein n=1 Tax=Bostrychia simpliciuscula TaxID=324754 RepID=A0A1Z1M7S1_9FLOR|nr:hypothetical protein [Bostrychia simpliciuscula]ARW62019.1 hypothetical protein [Bostrychia simpliciuscula]
MLISYYLIYFVTIINYVSNFLFIFIIKISILLFVYINIL